MRQINEVDLFSFDLLASFVVRFNQIVNDSTKKLKHTNSRLLIFHLQTLAGPDGESIRKWEFETGGKVSSSPAPLSVAGECG